MKIYLVYAAEQNGERYVVEAFSEEEDAKKYCKFWDKPDESMTYFYTEMKLDRQKEFINLVG